MTEEFDTNEKFELSEDADELFLEHWDELSPGARMFYHAAVELRDFRIANGLTPEEANEFTVDELVAWIASKN